MSTVSCNQNEAGPGAQHSRVIHVDSSSIADCACVNSAPRCTSSNSVSVRLPSESRDSRLSGTSGGVDDRKCTYCGKQFVYAKDLKRHLPTHTGLKPYNCEQCGKCFGRSDKLRSHIKLHSMSKNRKRKCVDGEMAQDASTMKDVLDANGRVTAAAATDTKAVDATNEKRRHMCSCCGKQFTREGNLTAHMRTHTGERPYVCLYCCRSFTRPERLKLHVRTHTGEKPYTCHHCCRSFSRRHNLRRHSLVHSTKQRQLLVDASSVASDVSPVCHRCTECGKVFSDGTRLKRHTLIHNDVRAHVCSYCGLTFTHLSNMNTHLRTHTGERPFVCSFCGKSFSKSSGSKRHEQQVHAARTHVTPHT